MYIYMYIYLYIISISISIYRVGFSGIAIWCLMDYPCCNTDNRCYGLYHIDQSPKGVVSSITQIYGKYSQESFKLVGK